MVEKTVRLYECGVCGREGKRYTILFEEGGGALDRCELHDKKILALLNEKDVIELRAAGKSAFKVSSPTDIRLAVARKRQGEK